MFVSRFMPCPQCGDSVERADLDVHRCDPERKVDFEMFALREEIAGLESQFREFLATTPGRFEAWLAARDVRR